MENSEVFFDAREPSDEENAALHSTAELSDEENNIIAMENSEEIFDAREPSDEENASLLRRGLLNWRANLCFAFITLIWMSVLAAHIYLRFPWGGKDITHSKWCCAYLIGPALLAVILGVVRVCIDPLPDKSGTLNAKILEIAETVRVCTDPLPDKSGTLNISLNAKLPWALWCAGIELKNSTSTQIKPLLVVLSILSIACMAVAGCLDRATDPSKIKDLAIAECTLLAGIITTLIALTFTCYIYRGGEKMSAILSIEILNIEINTTLQAVEVNTAEPRGGVQRSG